MESSESIIEKGSGVAVCLSSSFFGFYAHSGFIAELHKAGVFPDRVSGASAGAYVSLVCGMGKRGDEVVDFMMQPGMRRSFWDWGAPFRAPGVFTSMLFSGILSGKNVNRFLREKLGSPKIEDLKSPKVDIAVTDMDDRRPVVAETGDAIDYVVASLAIPGLFCNQKVDGKRLCDGGVAMNTPFLHWLDDPAISTIIVHRIKHTPGTELTTEWPTLSSGFATCHQVIADQVDKLQLELAAKQSGKRVIDIVTETAHPKLVPHGQRPELIETGRKSGRRTVELLRGD